MSHATCNLYTYRCRKTTLQVVFSRSQAGAWEREKTVLQTVSAAKRFEKSFYSKTTLKNRSTVKRLCKSFFLVPKPGLWNEKRRNGHEKEFCKCLCPSVGMDADHQFAEEKNGAVCKNRPGAEETL